MTKTKTATRVCGDANWTRVAMPIPTKNPVYRDLRKSHHSLHLLATQLWTKSGSTASLTEIAKRLDEEIADLGTTIDKVLGIEIMAAIEKKKGGKDGYGDEFDRDE